MEQSPAWLLSKSVKTLSRSDFPVTHSLVFLAVYIGDQHPHLKKFTQGQAVVLSLCLFLFPRSQKKDIFAIICITLLRISPVCLHMILAVSWTLRFWYYFPTTWFHPLCCIEGAVWALQQGAFKNWSLAESSLFSPPTTTMCTLWNLVWSLQNLPLLHLRPPWGTMPVVEVAENDKVGWLNQFLSHRYICLVPVLYVHLNQGIRISSRTFPAQFGLLWICWI